MRAHSALVPTQDALHFVCTAHLQRAGWSAEPLLWPDSAAKCERDDGNVRNGLFFQRIGCHAYVVCRAAGAAGAPVREFLRRSMARLRMRFVRSGTQSSRRSTVNGGISRPYALYLKSPRRRSARDNMRDESAG